MKKSKFITGLSAAFVSAMALVSCGTIKADNDVILYYDGIAITAEELFKDQMKTPDAAQACFNAVYKVAIRNWANKQSDSIRKEIENETNSKMSSAKEDARSNAEKNKTSYDVEFNKILSSNGVDSESKLYDKFEYDIQKTKFEDKFYENNYNENENNYYVLKKGGKFKNEKAEEHGKEIDGYFKLKSPYHMKHILVKTNDSEKFKTETITKEQASKISTIVRELANGTAFDEVAKLSDDTSKSELGSVGIMDVDTSFVDEFKLGTFLYESFFGSSTQSKHDETATEKFVTTIAKDGLNLSDKEKDDPTTASYYAHKLSEYEDPSSKIGNTYQGIGFIPYEAAELLGTYADKEYTKEFTAATGCTENPKFLPRNVLYNKYFNRHNICVITPNKLSLNPISCKDFCDIYVKNGKLRQTDLYNGNENKAYKELNGFKNTTLKNGDKLAKVTTDSQGKATKEEEIVCFDDVIGGTSHKNYLRTNEGRIIYVVKGKDGIHFLCIQRSPFLEKETEDLGALESKVTNDGVTLDEYYTTTYPGSGSNYPHYEPKEVGGNAINKSTFVTCTGNHEITSYKKNADTVKTKLKGYDSNLNKYIYYYLKEEGQFTFAEGKGKDVEKLIDNWFDISIATSKYEAKETWTKAWYDYYHKLQAQTEHRKQYEGTDSNGTYYFSEIVPDLCLYAFTKANTASDDTTETQVGKKDLKELFGQGGIFYEKQ